MNHEDPLRRAMVLIGDHLEQYAGPGGLDPHPMAATLTLPDGTPAPAELRTWAAFDNWYPTWGRSDQQIAGPDGVLLVAPMADVLRRVCVDDVVEELGEDDPEFEPDEDGESLMTHLNEVLARFVEKLPGYGLILEPYAYPDRVLWLPPAGIPTVLWYKHEDFKGQQAFSSYVADSFVGHFT